MPNLFREAVSKKKKRFIDTKDGFNLDLTYIGGEENQLIAMGIPSEGIESIYRNSMGEVLRFFNKRHGFENISIYNLCIERGYDLRKALEENKFDVEGSAVMPVHRYGFEDHNACPFDLINPFCENVAAWIDKNPKKIAAIHCKAGKGRTGLMISCFLVHSGKCATADEALFYFAEERTHNAKGVTIPSQMRYVHYYDQWLKQGRPALTPRTLQITHIRLVTVPEFNLEGAVPRTFRSCYTGWMRKVR